MSGDVTLDDDAGVVAETVFVIKSDVIDDADADALRNDADDDEIRRRNSIFRLLVYYFDF